jgi:putative DNA primase/helicase
LVTAGEPDQGVKFSESVIKMLTGEDEIQVCNKHENPFTYTPTYKIWLHCNYKPIIRGTDEGIWSRPRLIPFNVAFMTKEEAARKGVSEDMRRDPDKKLDAKLNAERAGILAWAVRGAQKWYIDGLGRSRTVEAATDDYRVESDQLGPFIEECLCKEVGAFVTNDRLFSAYEAWCRRNLVDFQMTGQTLSKQLSVRGFERGKNNKDMRGFKNLKIAQQPTLFAVAGAKEKEKS